MIKRKQYLLICLVVMTLFITSSAFAAGQIKNEKTVTGENTVNVNREDMTITTRLGIGYLNGKSTEFVYNADTGQKISELKWELSNIFMVNGGISVQPVYWLRLNADLWVAINDGNGDMDDFDWADGDSEWESWSHSEDLSLDKGTMFDINVEIPYQLEKSTAFSVFFGWKQDNWKWDARGGKFIYSSDKGFRDRSMIFDDGAPVITYEQWWQVPYIGLGLRSQFADWEIAARLIGSLFVRGQDEDHHHMRDLVFKDDFDRSSMWGADLTICYRLSSYWAITGSFNYQDYNTAKGSTKITDTVTGEQDFLSGDAAGGDNQLLLVSAAVSYRF